MTNRIPMNALQKALFLLLTQYQTTPVYDDVPPDAALPYISFGNLTCKPNGTKDVDKSDVTQQLDIWSEYAGKKEVNGIAEGVIAVLANHPLDLSADQFVVTGGSIDFFEAFPEEDGGFHGVLTIAVKIQNIKKEV